MIQLSFLILNCMKNIHINGILYLFQLIAHIFINNYILSRSNFSYMFRPAEATFKDNTDKFISVIPEDGLCRPKHYYDLIVINAYILCICS